MDLFKKCGSLETLNLAREKGIYPYFHVLESKQDTVVNMEGARKIMIGSNNYQGLTSDPRVIAAAVKATEEFGTGCSGSRFLNGTTSLHIELEKELAEFQAKVTAEKARQAELTAEITRLEKEGASTEELSAVRGQLYQTEENIDRLEKFTHNRELLIEMNRKAAEDEKKLKTYTLDEQKLFYESKRAKAEELLGSDNERIRKSAEERIARYDTILADLATKIEAKAAEEAAE